MKHHKLITRVPAPAQTTGTGGTKQAYVDFKLNTTAQLIQAIYLKG